ncbi:magnesium transporter CorA family protein [Aureliella helgolandensis]|nr:hypothetical protein [Aureliella helgolandensis]
MPRSLIIPPNWQLPDALRKRVGNAAGRQRMMQHEQQLLIVAHLVPEPGEHSRRGVLFWRDGQAEWHASNGDPGKVAIDQLLGNYAKALEVFDGQEARAKRADEYVPILEGLAPLSRAVRNFSDVLQEARRAAPDCDQLIDARDRAYEIARTAELLYQDTKNSMDIAVVRRAEEQALASQRTTAAAHRLNTMAALFFPLATLGAIFGTTLTENWSWSFSSGPFILFLLSGLVAGVALAVFVNRPVKTNAD